MSGAREMIDAFRRWLPYPVYRFVGGPRDGQTHEVELIRHQDGMFPPRMLAVDEWPPFDPFVAPDPEAVAAEVTVRRHFYRFVPGRHINEGHYELVAEARR